MVVARRTLMALAWLYLLGVGLQFLFAGMGLLGGDDMALHVDFGWAALHLTPILLVPAAVIGKAGRDVIILTIVLVVTAFIQPLLVTEFRGEFLGALHVPNALLITALTMAIARRATALSRAPGRASSAAG